MNMLLVSVHQINLFYQIKLGYSMSCEGRLEAFKYIADFLQVV